MSFASGIAKDLKFINKLTKPAQKKMMGKLGKGIRPKALDFNKPAYTAKKQIKWLKEMSSKYGDKATKGAKSGVKKVRKVVPKAKSVVGGAKSAATKSFKLGGKTSAAGIGAVVGAGYVGSELIVRAKKKVDKRLNSNIKAVRKGNNELVRAIKKQRKKNKKKKSTKKFSRNFLPKNV